MGLYFFDVTIRLCHEGERIDTRIYKGMPAADELSARRAVLYRYLDHGFQVVRIERTAERTVGGDGRAD